MHILKHTHTHTHTHTHYSSLSIFSYILFRLFRVHVPLLSPIILSSSLPWLVLLQPGLSFFVPLAPIALNSRALLHLSRDILPEWIPVCVPPTSSTYSLQHHLSCKLVTLAAKMTPLMCQVVGCKVKITLKGTAKSLDLFSLVNSMRITTFRSNTIIESLCSPRSLESFLHSSLCLPEVKRNTDTRRLAGRVYE